MSVRVLTNPKMQVGEWWCGGCSSLLNGQPPEGGNICSTCRQNGVESLVKYNYVSSPVLPYRNTAVSHIISLNTTRCPGGLR